MTPQEQQLLNSLVERVKQTQLQEKDLDAEGLLNRALGSNPDALYILAQTVLVQNIGLEQAKAQVVQLQQQLAQAQQQTQQPTRATSFLGGLLGHHEPVAQPQQGYAPVAQAQPAYGQTPAGYQPVAQPGYGQAYVAGAQPQYVPAGQPQFLPGAGGQPSFLRGAMQTAAGVAAGALAFEGAEAVLHEIAGIGHPGMGWGGVGAGFGGGAMDSGFQRPVEETVINNYYDQPGGQGGVEHMAGDHPWHDAGTPGIDQGGAQFEPASYNTAGNDQLSYDAGDAAVANDDGGQAFDSGGGFDGGGAGFDDGGGGFGGDDGSGSLV